MLDGDVNNARYVIYKYRNKKEKLWKGLEKKYDIPVYLEDEWEDYLEQQEDGDEAEDLDDEGEDSTDEKEQEL